jgi:hypothetical protein
MDIELVRRMRNDLELEILDRLTMFRRVTGVDIRSLRVDIVDVTKLDDTRVVMQPVQVTLGLSL